MRAGAWPKIQYARLLGAALAHLIAAQGDAIGLVDLRHHNPDGTSRAASGRYTSAGVLTALTKMEASGSTSAAAPLGRGSDLLNRRGLLIVISDLYEENEAVESQLRRAVRMGHEVAVFHILTRDELEFPFPRDVELEDLESGQTILAGAGSAAEYRSVSLPSSSSDGGRAAPAITSTTRAS